MMNTIRADIYRILHGKVLYITFALLLVFALVGGAHIGVGAAPVNTDGQPAVTGAVAARQILSVMDNLIYFLIPLFIAAAMAMFSCGSVKNSLSAGISRTKLYLSAWILGAVMCVLLMLVYMVVGILAATVAQGFGSWTGVYFLTILRAFGAQFVLMLAFNSVGIFLSFVVRHTAAVTGIYIAFALVPTAIVGILSNNYTSSFPYYNYDLTMCMELFSYIENMSNTKIMSGLLLGAGYTLVSTAAGIALFKRAEIK